MPKKIDSNIVCSIRQEYISGVRFSDLKNKYSIGDRALSHIIKNERHKDPNYIPPTEKRTTNMGLAEFVRRATIVHDGYYDYSKSQYKCSGEHMTITCRFHGDFVQMPEVHLRGAGCRICANKKIGDKLRANADDIKMILHGLNIEMIDEYTRDCDSTRFKCLICHNTWITCVSHIKDGTKCPNCMNCVCNNEKIDAYILYNNSDIIRLDDYIDSYTKYNWKCLKCNLIWKTLSGVILRGSGCPVCSINGRKNEKLVGNFLQKYNIKYEKISIKIDNKRYHPDYYLTDLNMYIEYNGSQHYQPVRFSAELSDEHWNDIFAKQQLRDNCLRQYCFDKNIKLLEIDGRKYTGKKLMVFLKEFFNVY